MKRNFRGFTIIEVVIALLVLMILSAIAITANGRVKENGRRTVCQNQLRQVSLALTQYVSDSDGKFPGDHFQSQLQPYIKPSGWIECPTHELLSVPKPAPVDLRAFYFFGYNYNGVNLSQRTKDSSGVNHVGSHEAAIEDGSKIWTFGDDKPYGLVGGTGSGGFMGMADCADATSTSFWAQLHQGGANYVFVDGHIKWLTPELIQKIQCAHGEITNEKHK